MYYNYKFNQNSILNFVIKERGAGKTYAILKKRKEVKERGKTH